MSEIESNAISVASDVAESILQSSYTRCETCTQLNSRKSSMRIHITGDDSIHYYCGVVCYIRMKSLLWWENPQNQKEIVRLADKYLEWPAIIQLLQNKVNSGRVIDDIERWQYVLEDTLSMHNTSISSHDVPEKSQEHQETSSGDN